jgi:glyoxylase-like metal-dependent hydrolase (beta-lactamase superfamily II)
MDKIIRVHGIENAYLVKGEHCYLVDTMTPFSRKKLYKALQNNSVAPADLSDILITHCHFDHVGNLAGLLENANPTVVAGIEDAPCIRGEVQPPPPSDLNRLGRLGRKTPWLVERYQKCQPAGVDLTVAEGDRLEELGLEVIALPGHTLGGRGYLDRANRHAFVGDLVSNYFGRLGGPTLSASYSLEEIEASMRKLAGLDLDYMYPGHGRIIGPGASRMVEKMLRKKFQAAAGSIP